MVEGAEPPTPGDVAAVTRQLGRVPRGLLAVIRRSRCGFPQVVLTAPLLPAGAQEAPAAVKEAPEAAKEAAAPSRRQEPPGCFPEAWNAGDGAGDPGELSVFPTQFWLTCPLLYEAISLLEAEGWIQRLEERLNSDRDFREAMAEAHRGAAAFRVSLIPPAWRERLQHPRFRGQWNVLARSGVAGIREAAAGRVGGVKCLHAHYADWVGRKQNPIGAWVAQTLRERGVPEGCDDDCVRRCGPQP